MLPPKNFVNQDPWLKPYASAIESRLKYISSRTRQLLDNKSIDEFALGHLYYGLHKTESGWIFREWAPNATKVYLVGDFNGWQDNESFRLKSRPGGIFELEITHEKIVHQQKYKLHIYWPGGDGYRMPSYTTRAVQDPETHNFDAQVWQPTSDYRWRHKSPPATSQPPVIYEAHIGMSGQDPEVASYRHFTKNILPRIQTAGYNTVQLMAVQEHPYYGSYGYHVSNLFAASSRYGTPEELKTLIDTAHSLGLRVILDIVHSHAIKNENEGLAKFDGTANQYFHAGERGQHIAWDSLCYDYGKPEVVHYLLSNCRYWLDEYRFDGFRFDGVTSMLYSHHGLAKAFTS
ncbi:1,4-alpha-glucan-branching enzyme, partial [Candidatus Saccharibacteria bacterium 32-49-10]